MKFIITILVITLAFCGWFAFILSVDDSDSNTTYSESIVEQEKVIPANHELCSVLNKDCTRQGVSVIKYDSTDYTYKEAKYQPSENSVYDVYDRKISKCNSYGSPGNFVSTDNQFAWNNCMNNAQTWLNNNLP